MNISHKTLLTALSALAIAAPLSAGIQIDGPGDIERAREVRGMAHEVANNIEYVNQYAEASTLYRQAAELFGETAEAAEAWALAGQFAYYAGDDKSVSYFEKAGEIATTHGHVGLAARAYLDGAWIANRSGEGAVALEMAERGQRLAESPYLSTTEREELARRVAEKTGEIQGL